MNTALALSLWSSLPIPALLIDASDNIADMNPAAEGYPADFWDFGPIEAAANIQLDTCSPNFLIQEAIGTWDGFHSEILKKPLQIESGFIIPSKEPGIGVELDEEVAENNPYSGDILHLNPSEEPLWG